MTPFVVLALAVMVTVLGVVLVAGLQVRRTVVRLSDTARASGDRLRPLVDELRQGTVATTAEIEALSASAERLSAARRGRSRASR